MNDVGEAGRGPQVVFVCLLALQHALLSHLLKEQLVAVPPAARRRHRLLGPGSSCRAFEAAERAVLRGKKAGGERPAGRPTQACALELAMQLIMRERWRSHLAC